MRASHLPIVVAGTLCAGAAPAAEPSFSCKAPAGEIEAMVCGDDALAGLDRTLAATFAAAKTKTDAGGVARLIAEQRGWVKGRDDCWKSEDKAGCARDAYVTRIAELQARYRLVPMRGPFFWACDGEPANEVVVTFFETEPPTLIAERGDSTSLMFVQRSGSGARYQGRNETFWEHQGEAKVTWGYGAPEMTCVLKPRP